MNDKNPELDKALQNAPKYPERAMDPNPFPANAEGVWYMPFVGSDNNKFVTTCNLRHRT